MVRNASNLHDVVSAITRIEGWHVIADMKHAVRSHSLCPQRAIKLSSQRDVGHRESDDHY